MPPQVGADSVDGSAGAEPGGGGGGWKQTGQEGEAGDVIGEEDEGEEDEEALAMHPLCPLHDGLLPLDTADLKTRQLRHALEQLQQGEQQELGQVEREQGAEPEEQGAEDALEGEMRLRDWCAVGGVAVRDLLSYPQSPWLCRAPACPTHSPGAEAARQHLEALARLSWGAEEARQELGARRGVEAVVGCMRRHAGSAAVQCNGCLALMAMVRGEGEGSEANRVRLADCGGVAAIADGEHALFGLVQKLRLLSG